MPISKIALRDPVTENPTRKCYHIVTGNTNNIPMEDFKWYTEGGKSKFGEVIYMKKSTSRIVGLVMLIIAVAFVIFALNHPEMSFPWNNTITWLLYGLYILVTVVLLIAPKMKK